MPRAALNRRIQSLSLGDLSLRLSFPSRSWLTLFERNYRHFTQSARCRGPFITVNRIAGRPPRDEELIVSETPAGWSIHRPDFASITDASSGRTTLSVERNKYSFDSWLRVFCTLYGLSRDALLVHSAGYCIDGETFLFPGRSGRGKSTLIRILGKPGALSDELTLLYRRRASFRAASTPFWGELKKGTGALHDGRLKAICFLEHGHAVASRRVTPKEALHRFLSTVLFFSRESASAARLLDIGADLLEKVPSYIFTFAKDSRRAEIIDHLAALQS